MSTSDGDRPSLALTEQDWGSIKTRIVPLCTGESVSGAIAATDPLWYRQEYPTLRTSQAQVYTAQAVLAYDDSGSARCAFARLDFSDLRPSGWTRLVDDVETPWTVGESYTVMTDSPFVVLGDAGEVQALSDRCERAEDAGDLFDELRALVDEWDGGLGCCAPFPGASGHQSLAVYAAGRGTGMYSVYLGYRPPAQLCCLVVDFEVV